MVLPTYPFERQRYWIDAPKAAGRELPPLQKADVADWFYLPAWKPAPAVSPNAALAAAARWMVFEEAGDGPGARVASHLSSTARELIIVRAGQSFAEAPDGSFTIDPGKAEDYRTLFRALKASDRLPDVIGHFWGVTRETPAETSDSDACQRHGFYSLLYLTQALGESGSRAPVRIGVVTSDVQSVVGDETLCPSKATVLGLCRVIPAEYPHITCRAIDVAASDWTGKADAPVAELIAALASDTDDPVVAHRRGQWWMPSLEPTRLEAPDAATRRRGCESTACISSPAASAASA